MCELRNQGGLIPLGYFKGNFFVTGRKLLLWQNACFFLLIRFLSKTFLILRRIQQDIING